MIKKAGCTCQKGVQPAIYSPHGGICQIMYNEPYSQKGIGYLEFPVLSM